MISEASSRVQIAQSEVYRFLIRLQEAAAVWRWPLAQEDDAHKTGRSWPLMAGWSRPAFADGRPVCTRFLTFRSGPPHRQPAVTLN